MAYQAAPAAPGLNTPVRDGAFEFITELELHDSMFSGGVKVKVA